MHLLRDHNDRESRGTERQRKKDHLLPQIALKALGISELMSAKPSEPPCSLLLSILEPLLMCQAICRHLGINSLKALAEFFILLFKTQTKQSKNLKGT